MLASLKFPSGILLSRMTRRVLSYSNENVSVRLVISLKEGQEDGRPLETETATPIIATKRKA